MEAFASVVKIINNLFLCISSSKCYLFFIAIPLIKSSRRNNNTVPQNTISEHFSFQHSFRSGIDQQLLLCNTKEAPSFNIGYHALLTSVYYCCKFCRMNITVLSFLFLARLYFVYKPFDFFGCFIIYNESATHPFSSYHAK